MRPETMSALLPAVSQGFTQVLAHPGYSVSIGWIEKLIKSEALYRCIGKTGESTWKAGKFILHDGEMKRLASEKRTVVTKSWMINSDMWNWDRVRAAKAEWKTWTMWKCVADHLVQPISLTIVWIEDNIENFMTNLTKLLQKKQHLSIRGCFSA